MRHCGGLRYAGSLTQVVLSLLGHLSWDRYPKVPVEFLLLPPWFPVNLFDFVGFTRVHVVPILVAADRKYAACLPERPDLSGWEEPKPNDIPFILSDSPLNEWVNSAFSSLPVGTSRVFSRREAALKWAETFMLERLEPDGTLYSYFTSTFLMVFALLALGYPKDHPVMVRALRGLRSFVCPLAEGLHLQETTSTVWDTSLITHALLESGLKPDHPAIGQSLRYLLSRQQTKRSDWELRNPGVPAGGWGFSDLNTLNPDMDDTSACLRALTPAACLWGGKYQSAWDRGMTWMISMQNRDGGWSAFEKNTDKKWPQWLLPFHDARTVWTDPSTADLTGRTLECVCRYTGLDRRHPVIRRAAAWLVEQQQRDGSWFGRWGIAYVYGTWAALTGLAAAGWDLRHPTVRRGVRWLLRVQRPDGGWGESCRSDRERRYVPLPFSTPSQTAWALDALIAVHDRPTPEIKAGVRCLLDLLEKKDPRVFRYPTGAGLAGQFYIHYHSYGYIWPLLALSHYRNKYGDVDN
ncbi:terpene cyclase/mutase family protein [Polycladomyces zharkentensis]|uniref:terpene cyclase/mutase family protein n=1 Tax=Polycladomyces zharkentensis TaxID=2807616 RepID=UPI002FFB6859